MDLPTDLTVPRSETLWDTSVVHAIPGRVRLRVRSLEWAPELAGSLEAFLKAQPGMIDARVNSRCYSVTVTCDPSCWTAGTLCEFLAPLHHEEIERYSFLPLSLNNRGDATTKPWMHPVTRWTLLGCITLVLGILLFALPMIPGGTPLLLLSAFCFSKAASLKWRQAHATN